MVILSHLPLYLTHQISCKYNVPQAPYIFKNFYLIKKKILWFYYYNNKVIFIVQGIVLL